jgi:hypothetical protein
MGLLRHRSGPLQMSTQHPQDSRAAPQRSKRGGAALGSSSARTGHRAAVPQRSPVVPKEDPCQSSADSSGEPYCLWWRLQKRDQAHRSRGSLLGDRSWDIVPAPVTPAGSPVSSTLGEAHVGATGFRLAPFGSAAPVNDDTPLRLAPSYPERPLRSLKGAEATPGEIPRQLRAAHARGFAVVQPR